MSIAQEDEEVMEIQKRMNIGKAAARAVFRGETLNNNIENQQYVKYLNI